MSTKKKSPPKFADVSGESTPVPHLDFFAWVLAGSVIQIGATALLLRVMEELALGGMTMLVVTHELGFAREAGDRIVFLDGGVIVEEGTPESLLSRPQNPRTRQFLQAVL